MWIWHGHPVVLAAATVGFVCLTAAGARGIEKSGGTYHQPVCPKSTGAQIMRCHAHVVTDSKGNPIQTTAPPPHMKLPNSKQPHH
jgi:hypothetical protein